MIVWGIAFCTIGTLLAGGLYYLAMRARAQGKLTPWNRRAVGFFTLGAFIGFAGMTVNWLAEGELDALADLGYLFGGAFLGAAIATGHFES